VREVEISHEGETVRAYELEFTTENDNWGEYKTEERTRIKMRSVVARIYRLIDMAHEDGTPIHVLHGSVVIDTAPADTADKSKDGQ
jgi:hypothetical protein